MVDNHAFPTGELQDRLGDLTNSIDGCGDDLAKKCELLMQHAKISRVLVGMLQSIKSQQATKLDQVRSANKECALLRSEDLKRNEKLFGECHQVTEYNKVLRGKLDRSEEVCNSQKTVIATYIQEHPKLLETCKKLEKELRESKAHIRRLELDAALSAERIRVFQEKKREAEATPCSYYSAEYFRLGVVMVELELKSSNHEKTIRKLTGELETQKLTTKSQMEKARACNEKTLRLTERLADLDVQASNDEKVKRKLTAEVAELEVRVSNDEKAKRKLTAEVERQKLIVQNQADKDRDCNERVARLTERLAGNDLELERLLRENEALKARPARPARPSSEIEALLTEERKHRVANMDKILAQADKIATLEAENAKLNKARELLRGRQRR